MKLIHLSDLHIGKRVNEYPMLEDQDDILREIRMRRFLMSTDTPVVGSVSISCIMRPPYLVRVSFWSVAFSPVQK